MKSDVASIAVDLQMLWTLICSALVLFMQAGFCCLEAGSVRQKNATNVAVKNLVDMCVCVPAFFMVGYALMFGSDWSGLIGEPALFLSHLDPDDLASFLYQAAFCATAATIVSGGVAERCRFLPYLMMSAAVSLVIYPLYGHWAWGGGFLEQIGYHDFAGASVVHMLGAGVTLAGIQVLGAREGRFDEQGRAVRLPGSSLPMVALGVFVLLFGWIGFNGGSAPLGERTPLILVNTLLAACFGSLGAMLLGWSLRGVAQVEQIFNGLLGGLVAITACADVVSLQASAGIGVLGGIAVTIGSSVLERARLDDAVGAIPVHGFAGIVGILSVGLFAPPEFLAERGVARLELIGVQTLGAVVCAVWAYYVGYMAWLWVAHLVELRVSAAAERLGMDFSEHDILKSASSVVPGASRAAESTAFSR